MLVLSVPEPHLCRMQWLGDCVFRRFLGVDVAIEPAGDNAYTLSGEGRSLRMADRFLASVDAGDKDERAIPSLPLDTYAITDDQVARQIDSDSIPVLFGSSETQRTNSRIDTEWDILGGIFFQLSRFEEVVLPDRDEHDRFPASASLASKAGFMDRPIVDEYVEILWQMMQSLWPGLERESRRGCVVVTCDVDTPFDCARSSTRNFLRKFCGDLIKRADFRGAGESARQFYSYRRGRHEGDENYTFDWYMDICEKWDRKIAFYFIPDGTAGTLDGCYRLNDREIGKLIRMVSERGHEIGVHGSYNSYRNAEQISEERKRLRDACDEIGVPATLEGNRQHYLRWDTHRTPDNLDAAGFSYDTTGGYADHVGFRYGTARPFPMWSWQENRQLSLEQRPLILMETTLFSPQYMGRPHSNDTLDFALKLKRRALQHGGDFVLLWHNSSLKSGEDRDFFRALIQ